MKDARNGNHPEQKQAVSNQHRPEIRDNLDSRENLETNDHSGHNTKEVKSDKKWTGKDQQADQR